MESSNNTTAMLSQNNNQLLSEVDLAKAGHDLTSWLLQDDMCDQDFCYGAKESHSPLVDMDVECDNIFINIDDQSQLLDVGVAKIDEYFSTYKDETEQQQQSVEDEQEVQIIEPSANHGMLLNDDIHLDELMKAEMDHQQQLQQLQFIKEQEELELHEKEKQLKLKHERELQEAMMYQEQLIQEEKQQEFLQQKRLEMQQLQQQQQLLMKENFQDNTNSSDLLSEVGENSQDQSISVVRPVIDSPESAYGSADSSPASENGFSTSPVITSFMAPNIIPVTISEACQSISTKNLQFPQITFSDIDKQEKCEPGKLVIKVKKHCIPQINVTAPSTAKAGKETKEPAQERPTLKEVLQSDYAEDFIRDLMTSTSPAHSYQEDTCSSVMSDDSMDDEIPKDIGSLLSPTYSSYYSDSPSPSVSPSPSQSKSRIGVRSRPYAKADRKERKKEQNKRAALRYREKKKEEEMRLQKLVDIEEARRAELEERYSSLNMELMCLKKLAREMLAAQGKI